MLAVMPTIPERKSCKRVLEGLLKQGLSARVFLNGFARVPNGFPRTDVDYRLGPSRGPIIRYSESIVDHDVVFFVDDDIVYPTDYVKMSLRHLKNVGNRRAITWHGSYWVKGTTIVSRNRKCLRADGALAASWRVPYAGSGALVMWSSEFNPIAAPASPIFEFEDDIWISSQMSQHGIVCIRPPSSAGWIKALPLEGSTLWKVADADKFKKRDLAIAAARRNCPSWKLYSGRRRSGRI